MLDEKNFKYKEVKSKIDGIMNNYLLCKLKVEHSENEFLNPLENRSQRLSKCHNYINTVDLVLNAMSPADARIIKNISIFRVPFEELGYSLTTFYAHYRRAGLRSVEFR